MALSDTAIKNAKPSEKKRKLYDALGLYVIGHRKVVSGGDSITSLMASVKRSLLAPTQKSA